MAGLTPSQRPSGAPTIENAVHDKGWEKQFFYGIPTPYPPNLGGPANWGNWYAGFDRPGMTGGYDIRGWHSQKVEKVGGKPRKGKKP